jgi:hypothetical protein
MLTCTQFKIYVDAKDSVQNGIIFWERVCLRWKKATIGLCWSEINFTENGGWSP